MQLKAIIFPNGIEHLIIRKSKMNFRLVTFSTNVCTTGKWYNGDELICHTMELPWRDNAVDVSCIPAGEYRIKMTNSPKYGACYKVFDVDGRTDILIHKGNTVDDTLGCIMPVSTFGLLNTARGILVAGLSSKNAYDKLMNIFAGDSHWLTIERY